MVTVSSFVPGLLSKLPTFTFHASQCHSSVHGLLSHTTELISNFKLRFTQRLQLRLLSTRGYRSCHCPQCRCGEALIVYIYIRGDILPVILQRRGQFGGHAAPSKSELIRSINLKVLQIGECLTVVVVWRPTIPTSWAVTKHAPGRCNL
jgi:hypothetical protein